MQYSPKLKKAMEEIKSVLKKHDIAGFVVIHTPGFSENLNHITPSYSCAKMVTEGIQFKIESAKVGGKENATKIANDTYNMITHFADVIAPHAMMYLETKDYLTQELTGKKLPGDEESSHDQQNN